MNRAARWAAAPANTISFHMTLIKLGIPTLLALTCAMAAPKVDKVEPPNWWTPHTLNPVQVLLTGTELGQAQVSTTSKGFKAEVRKVSANGHYAFVYLNIGNDARPGTHRFQVKTPSGVAEFTFTLDRPLEDQGKAHSANKSRQAAKAKHHRANHNYGRRRFAFRFFFRGFLR